MLVKKNRVVRRREKNAQLWENFINCVSIKQFFFQQITLVFHLNWNKNILEIYSKADGFNKLTDCNNRLINSVFSPKIEGMPWSEQLFKNKCWSHSFRYDDELLQCHRDFNTIIRKMYDFDNANNNLDIWYWYDWIAY